MKLRAIYQKMDKTTNQIRILSEHEAGLHFRANALPVWDAPVVDLKNNEIIFKCILEDEREREMR